jgi:hypothetical protein
MKAVCSYWVLEEKRRRRWHARVQLPAIAGFLQELNPPFTFVRFSTNITMISRIVQTFEVAGLACQVARLGSLVPQEEGIF